MPDIWGPDASPECTEHVVFKGKKGIMTSASVITGTFAKNKAFGSKQF